MINLGLFLIVLGWAYQTWFLYKGNKQIQPIFIGTYALGVLFLVFGAPNAGVASLASLDGLSLIIAIFALILVIRKK
ncbi:MAG: hypothetical protein WAV11_02920 [Minisyncoccia bacterium]